MSPTPSGVTAGSTDVVFVWMVPMNTTDVATSTSQEDKEKPRPR
jgi:hypothetical protein